MVYNSSYQPSDMKGILIDLLGESGNQIILYLGLIIAIFVLLFFISRFKRH